MNDISRKLDVRLFAGAVLTASTFLVRVPIYHRPCHTITVAGRRCKGIDLWLLELILRFIYPSTHS